MVSNKWYNEAKPILDYIVCPIYLTANRNSKINLAITLIAASLGDSANLELYGFELTVF